MHGLRYGIDSDGSWPFGTQTLDGRRSDEYARARNGPIFLKSPAILLARGLFMIIEKYWQFYQPWVVRRTGRHPCAEHRDLPKFPLPAGFEKSTQNR